ncbi:hypothetical protein PE067_12555 [Paracoccus sp. DMF-8]|uniref:hypothetical protein n=1 Tax=Paracoccus sp. DMF-8 TaxID=3019445 RepID=UPI0023E8167D|nr:hypothetical protein [Paracoccus sp. DMF-8]MDF3606885.1 hypothetical protein [Paracoccus sp. DMF-8]
MNPLSPATTRPTGRGIGFYFWATILVLIAATLILVGLALLRPLPDAPPAPASLTQQQLGQIETRARQAGAQAVAAHLDPALDRMFRPVHAAIPAYADFHYSVWGQYAELLAAGAETLGIEEEVGSLMRQHLFAGFEDRHSAEMAALTEIYRTTVTDAFTREGERLAETTGQPLTDAIEKSLHDAQRRMLVTAPLASASATVAVVAIVKPIAKKVVAATAAKAAAKGLGKAGGIGGAAAAGAAAGSVVGPVGTVVGGVAGAVVGWLAVDYAVVKLDEYFNREEFEAGLATAIDEQKAAMRQSILNSVGATPG